MQTPDLDYATIPESGTVGCDRFFEEHRRLSHFIGFVSSLAVASDEVQRVARKALGAEPFDDKKGAVETLRRHRQLLLQVSLTRGVDNYLTYIADLLAVLFASRPETLRAQSDQETGRRGEQLESVPLDMVLQHATLQDLIDALAERRVTDLSHRGMASLSGYLSKKLGFELVPDHPTFDKIVYIVEVRNLIVHNRAVVNRLFRQRVSDDSVELGSRVTLDVNGVFTDLDVLAHSVADIDDRAISKWSLPTVAFERRPLLPPEE